MDLGHRPRAIALLISSGAALGTLAACHDDHTNADFTGINVVARFEGKLVLDHLDISGTLTDGTAAFMKGQLAVPPAAMPPETRTESIVVLLPRDLAGKKVHVTVDGLTAANEILVSGSKDITLSLGEILTASVAMGSPSTCGDGRINGSETCDDANVDAGDGCSDKCAVERGWVCALTPSRCFDQSTTVFVDAGAPCAGDGSEANPFCSISTGANAPRAATVIVRRGLYAEQAALDHVRATIAGEPGAVLESDSAPALHISGTSIVTVLGLTVRGKNDAGGGVLVEGAGTSVELNGVEVGPGGAGVMGVSLGAGATLRLLASKVHGNAGGGVKLDSDTGYRLENDLITGNGAAASDFGGIAIERASADSRVVNTTVAENSSPAVAGASGIRCAVDATIANSIIWANEGGEPISANICHAAYSDLGPFAMPPGQLGSNFSLDPLLGADFHLDPASPCKDRGDPTGVQPAGVAPKTDVDGEARPRGMGVDVGADEVG